MQHWHGKWHKAHQNQQEPSHWLKSSWEWPPLSVWVNLASSRTGSQNSFSHFVLAKVPFRVGQGNFPLWFLPLRYSHTWGSSWGSKCELWLSQGTHTHRDVWVFVQIKDGIETKMRPSWWQNCILLQRHEKWVRTSLLIRSLECRVVYHHFPIADEISRANGNSPTFSRSLRDLLKLIVEASNHFQLILCH